MISIIMETKLKKTKIVAGTAAALGAGYGAKKAAEHPTVQQAMGKAIYKGGKLLGKEKAASRLVQDTSPSAKMGYIKASLNDAKKTAEENIHGKISSTAKNIMKKVQRASEEASEHARELRHKMLNKAIRATQSLREAHE